MSCYAGIDVSLEGSCICVIDVTGKVVRESMPSTRHPSSIGTEVEERGSVRIFMKRNPRGRDAAEGVRLLEFVRETVGKPTDNGTLWCSLCEKEHLLGRRAHFSRTIQWTMRGR
jgi:hypothetical protein